jgi:hypothetical protein
MRAKEFIDKKNFNCIDVDTLLADLLEN